MSFQVNDIFRETCIVSENVYKGFIELFHDNNPLHTDDAFAKARGFSGRVMHGNILNGFISYFIGKCLPVKNVIIHKQQIDYKNPVYLGDQLQLEVTVKEVYESVQAVVLSFVFTNASNKTVAKGNIQIGLLS